MPHSHIVDQPIALFYIKSKIEYVSELWNADPNFI